MSSARVHSSNSDDAAARPLISRSTVYIIGGLLIGLTLGNAVQLELRSYVFLAGACGIIAYLGLTCVASIRRRRASERRQHERISQLEARVDHHIHASDHC